MNHERMKQVNKEMISLMSEIERHSRRQEHYREIAFSGMMLALEDGDDKKLEESRIESVETYTAYLDQFLANGKKLFALRAEAAKLMMGG